ncbi:NADH:quinone oxidoreductase I, chain G [Campylobacter sputorum bv. faecalis CCUG 20703]|nr:NADH:quinone oxidoreductase I, chain G [Campylobacter sputorum bv. faecalis CCUG 20703]
MITIRINDQICQCDEGEYILNVARANGIFIPTMCYLSQCSPTLACRLCMGEVDGKRVYTCNAKAKDGMVVYTNTPDILEERNAIMQTYCVNHPLECGVCDKSGECHLQNLTHHMKVDEQNFSIKDSLKKVKDWGFISYDPSLCVVCERCITVCKDKIGDNILKTTPRNADQVPKELKETMSKDAHFVWSKMQKNLIGKISDDNCVACGECAAVCPVGALVQTHFKYTSNAWELTRIPASNPHSSDCELIYYDVKQTSIEDKNPKIYRVSNDYEFGEINGAARFGYDFENGVNRKDKINFQRIVEKIKNGEIKTIKFNSFITNEEAFLLNKFKYKFGIKLINEEARIYQNFLKNFSKTSGSSLYNGDFESLRNAEFIVVAGSFLRSDSPNTSYKINNALKINKASGIYFHPLGDKVVDNYSKNFLTCKHSYNQDSEILLWILQRFASSLPINLQDKLNQEFKEIQTTNEDGTQSYTKISKFADILGFDEQKVLALSDKKEKLFLIIGEDFYYSKNAKTLAMLTGLVQKYTPFKVILIPSCTNSLGVSLICDLDEKQEGFTLGYNENCDITFSVFGGDLDAPALNEQEGTFCNIEKRVVPTNAALPYNGYELNDFAKELGFGEEFAIDFTPKLSENLHFKSIKFDDLENFYDNAGNSHRGYKLDVQNFQSQDEVDLSDILQEDMGETLIYRANPVYQFSKFTNRASLLNESASLYVSSEFLEKYGLDEKSVVIIKKDDIKFAIKVSLDKNLAGDIAYLPTFDEKIPFRDIFSQRFASINLTKGGSDE